MRLEYHVKQHGLLPDSMIGFRKGISTQDVFPVLRKKVLNPPPGSLDRILLALEINMAFDIVSHEAVPARPSGYWMR